MTAERTAEITVRPATPDDVAEWLRMQKALFGDHTEIAEEMQAYFARNASGEAALIAECGGKSCGYVVVGTRSYAEGCASSPVAYVEALYVDPEWRRKGAGRALLAAAETWARARGFSEIASDATLDNAGSVAMHVACGFDEMERIVCLRKGLSA
ncbi:MAG: N-acetyltransferase family protein [Parvibaculaceae bacterium]